MVLLLWQLMLHQPLPITTDRTALGNAERRSQYTLSRRRSLWLPPQVVLAAIITAPHKRDFQAQFFPILRLFKEPILP